jgi:GNAT superfamily N-acetyltransferase
MRHEAITGSTRAKGTVRTLRQQEELPLLRDHLLRLDPESRHDRFHGFMDDSFIERYAKKCADDGTVIIAYIEDGVVRGAAELHPPDQSPDSLPEIAFSVEARVRRQGVGSILFRKLIAEARAKGYQSLRITTGAQNQAMRALAHKFGAHLTFRHGESTGSIDLKQRPAARPARARFATPAERRADDQHQSRLLADVAANVRLGPDGLTGSNDSVFERSGNRFA